MRHTKSRLETAPRRKRIALAMSWEMPGQSEGVVRYAYQAGWNLRFISPVGGNELRAWKPDGIICQLWHENPDLVSAVQSAGVPTVDLYAFVPSLKAVRVRVDATAAGRAAAGHLIERRFRRLVHVGRWGWPKDNNYVLGFDDGARAEGIEVLHFMTDDPANKKKSHTWDGQFGMTADQYPQFILDLTEKLAHMHPLPIAVFCQSTLLALDLVDALVQRGFSIPEQVAILTLWERPDENCLAQVPLSYIRDDNVTQGYRAAATLDFLMQGKPVPPVQWIPPLPVVALESTDTLAINDLRVSLALKHLREHACDTGFAPKLAAQDLGITVRTLQRWFDEHVGQSPTDYIALRRVARAAHLMATSDLSFAKVARQAGFSDYQQLKRALRKYRRTTPQSLRMAAARQRAPATA